MIALRAARLFDGEQLIANPIVVLDGDHIVSVGIDPPDGADVIDLGDATLLPGFVDTHLHLVFNGEGSLEEQVAGFSDDELRDRARASALTCLAGGVTTMRDLGDRNYVTLALRGDPDLPTIFCAGPPLTPPQGHCWYLNGETEPEGLAAAVAEHHERGVDVIKIMVSGGHGTPTYPMHVNQFTTEQVQQVVDAAHQLGLPVAAHCHGPDSIASSVAARVDTIEHCSFIGEDMMAHPVEALIDEMAEHNIVLSATVGVFPGAEPPQFVKDNLAMMLKVQGRLHKIGGSIAVGTDAGIAPPKNHGVYPYAFGHLQEMGLSRADALTAMTAVGARVLGLQDSKGRIAPGYDADLVAVAGNPLDDGDVVGAVGVWLRGTRVVG